jgi:hypothetical protein
MHFAMMAFFVLFFVPFIIEPKGTRLLWSTISLFIGKVLLVIIPIAAVVASIIGTILIILAVRG